MRRSPDFASAVRRGRRTGRRRLVLHLLVRPADGDVTDQGGALDDPALVGFVVSRAVGGSVVRNRVERRLRHQVAARLGRLPRGCRLVVRATPAAAGATSAELGADLDSALNSVLRGLLREPAGS